MIEPMDAKGRPHRFVHGHNGRKDFYETIYSKLECRDGCWEWTGLKNGRGYGLITLGQPHRGGRARFAHRVMYELLVGPIPDGLHLLHHCDNPSCVRFDHLYPGTDADNVRDMIERGRGRNGSEGQTHCKRGHEFTPENTRIDKRGARCCRACGAMHQRAYLARKKG